MKDLIISHNEDKGFYCEEFNNQMFFVVLAKLIEKHQLKTDQRMKSSSEIERYFSVKELNKDKFNIDLRNEDGSEWVFG